MLTNETRLEAYFVKNVYYIRHASKIKDKVRLS